LLEVLWSTTITMGDVVIAGVGAAAELPANTTWLAILCDAGEQAQLDRVLGGVGAVSVDAGGYRFEAAFTDRMAATTAARVGGHSVRATSGNSTVTRSARSGSTNLWSSPWRCVCDEQHGHRPVDRSRRRRLPRTLRRTGMIRPGRP